MANDKEIVIDLKINAAEALDSIAKAKSELDKLAIEQLKLRDAYKQGSLSSAEFDKKMAQLTATQKMYKDVVNANQKVLVNELKAHKDTGDSLNAMRAKLSNLVAEYNNLSKAERESSKGQGLLEQIKEQTAAVSDLEHQLGNYTRQVGHYELAVENMSGPVGKAVNIFKQLSGGTMQLGVAFKNGVGAVKSFGTQLLKLLANPIVAIIAAIALAVMKLVDAFKKNDEATTRLQTAFAQFQPILNVLNKAFDSLANGVSKLIYGWSKMVTSVLNLIPAYRESAKAAEELVKEQDKIEAAEREYSVNSAKRNKKISENNAKIADRERHTAKERIKLLNENAKLEKANAKEAADIAKRKYEAAKRQAEQDKDTSDATMNNLAELQAAAIDAEAAYSDALVSINRRTSQAIRQVRNEAKEEAAAAKERAKIWKEYRENQLSEERALQDAIIGIVREGIDKQIAMAKIQASRQIEDLKKKLNDADSKLTAQARKALNEQIILLEANLQMEIGRIRQKYREEDIAKELAYRIKIAQQELQLQTEGTEAYHKAENRLLNEQFDEQDRLYEQNIKKLTDTISENFSILGDNKRLQREAKALGVTVDEYRNMVVKANAELNAEISRQQKERANNEAIYNKESEDRERKHQENLANIRKSAYAQAQANELNRLLLQADQAEVESAEEREMRKAQITEEYARKRLKTAQDEYEALKSLSDEEIKQRFGTEENYNLALEKAIGTTIAAENELNTAIKNTANASITQKNKMVDTYLQIGSAVNSVAGSLQGMFEQLAESDEKYSDYATGMALLQILVSTAISIANAVQGATAAAAATGPGAPIATPIFIAEMVGIVTGALASAVTTLLKAKQSKPSTPHFATGGYVSEGLSGVDKVDAKLTKGEYVINKKRVDELGVDFLDRLNFGSIIPKPNMTGHYATGGIVTQSVQVKSSENEINMQMMKDMFAEVVSDIQPVVSVKEITKVQNRVKTKELR